MKKAVFFLLAAALLTAGCACKAGVPRATEAATPIPAVEEPSVSPGEDEPLVYSNVTLTVRRNAETVSERAITSAEEIAVVNEVIFDCLAKSAAWEGIEVSELEEYIALSFDWTMTPGRQSFFQYDTEGRHVLQMGETGMYSMMSQGAYNKLLALAGLPADPSIGVEEATALLLGRFGERDAATGNSYSFGYLGTLTVDGKDYYRFRISWLVDNDHLSYLTDYLVATDGSDMKEYLP